MREIRLECLCCCPRRKTISEPSPCLASQFFPQPRGIIQLIAPFCLLCLVFQLNIKRFFKISDNRNLILFASSSPSSRFVLNTNTNRWARWVFLQGSYKQLPPAAMMRLLTFPLTIHDAPFHCLGEEI